MKKIINILEKIINKLNNMSDRGKAILGYTVIGLALLGPIVLIIELITRLF